MAKTTDRMSRAIGQLEKMFRAVNRDFFNGELETPIITVQSTKGKSYGYSKCFKTWKKDGEIEQYEICIASECLDMEIECTLDTLIHETIHLYCRIKGIKETSRGTGYHNKKFKELAEKCGLICFYTQSHGWNTDHRGNEKLTEYAIKNDFYEIKIGETMPNFGFTLTPPSLGTGTGTPTPAPTPTTSSTVKYKCPVCGTKIRATKDLDGQLKHEPCKAIFIRF